MMTTVGSGQLSMRVVYALGGYEVSVTFNNRASGVNARFAPFCPALAAESAEYSAVGAAIHAQNSKGRDLSISALQIHLWPEA